jgi:hypothetical protein
MTPPIPARFNFHCDDPLRSWNFGHHGTALLFGTPWRSASEIVIAIRYQQAEGMSYSHLYLYREDGKLLRQLTNDDSEQDSAPIFASDGNVIVFKGICSAEPTNSR